MTKPDLNLLVTLDALLAESSVAGAARRLKLSPSAMSRALARLRETTGDPLLVRAGRGLVPTPRALELRELVPQLVQDAEAALRPADVVDMGIVERSFTLRVRDGFVENFGPALVGRAADEAPGVQLRFVQKVDRDSAPLRDGAVDLDTGVIGETTGPELRAQSLFRDRWIGTVRDGHPLGRGKVTPERYAAASHVAVSRRGRDRSAVDAALDEIGLARRVITVVDGFAGALALARDSDLIATVPDRQTANLRTGMRSFPLPVPTPQFTVSLMWHPRMDADPVHRWLRGLVREVCAAAR